MRVAIIERKWFGGTGFTTGCTPTKTMIASAQAAHVARRAADFGVEVDRGIADMKRVKSRKDAVSEEWRSGVEAYDQFRRSVPGIWALGDCNGKGAFTRTAFNDFEIAGQ